MRWNVSALALTLATSPVQADSLSGVFVGAGVGAVHSGGSGTVTRTTSVAGVVIDQRSASASAGETTASQQLSALYQSRLGPALVGAEMLYEFRNLDIAADGSIFAAGARTVSHLGDRGSLHARVGYEFAPRMAFYGSVGASYAWANESYLRLANGAHAQQESTKTWNVVLGSGLQYAIGDVMLDLRVLASPGKKSDVRAVQQVGFTTAVFDTKAESEWTYSVGIAVRYRLY